MNELTNVMLLLMFWCYQISRFGIYAAQNVLLIPMNQTEISDRNMLIPPETPNPNELEQWHNHNQTYGVLVMSQRATGEAKVPVWKFIDERLKDIDLFVEAVHVVMWDLKHWSSSRASGDSGAGGVLTLYNGTSNVDKIQLMYSWDAELQRMVPIPKFVYRIITAHCSYSYNFWDSEEGFSQDYNAVIVIHNDPTASYDDRLDCERCDGWGEIENIWMYDEPGLSYVCHLTEEISKILGLDYFYDPTSKPEPLNLDNMRYSYRAHPEWTSLTDPWGSGDRSYRIYEVYKTLKE